MEEPVHESQNFQSDEAGPVTGAGEERPGESSAAETVADASLTEVLESTLTVLNEAIDRLESIVTSMEAGEADWEQSVRLLAEANELAVSSSQRLDRVVQDVVYGGSGGAPETGAAPRLEGFDAAIETAAGAEENTGPEQHAGAGEGGAPGTAGGPAETEAGRQDP